MAFSRERILDALSFDAPSEFVRAYPVSWQWLAQMLRRMDAVASMYRLAATLSPGVDGLCSRVEFQRRGWYDAVIALHYGRSFGVVRQSHRRVPLHSPSQRRAGPDPQPLGATAHLSRYWLPTLSGRCLAGALSCSRGCTASKVSRGHQHGPGVLHPHRFARFLILAFDPPHCGAGVGRIGQLV